MSSECIVWYHSLIVKASGGHAVDINALRIYCAVAAEGSITRAAHRLRYVPSNVTARIQQLERELGAVLLERHPRGVRLTSAGVVFRAYAEQIVQLGDQAMEVLHDPVHVTGDLRIGSIESAAALHMPDILTAFQQRHPGVTVHFATAETPGLYAALQHYEIDGAVVDGPVDDLQLAQEPLYDEHLVLVSARDRHPSSLQDLSRHPVLLPFAGCGYGTRLAQWGQSEGVVFPQTMEVGTLDGIIACVAKGFGISVLPLSAVVASRYSDRLAWRPLSGPYGRVPILFVRPRRWRPSRPLDAFLGVAREVMRHARPTGPDGSDQP